MRTHPNHLGPGTQPSWYAIECCRLVSLSGVGAERASIIVKLLVFLPYYLCFSIVE